MRASQGVPGRWVSINARPIRDDAGVLCGTVVVFHDITWLKRAQDALFESEYRFRSLVEGARDIIFTLSPDTTMTSLNQAFETVTNWSRSQWIGEPLATLLHPDDAGFCQDVLQAILERGTPLTCSMQISTKQGGYVTGEFVGTPQLRQGRVVGVADYRRVGDVVVLPHTEVDRSLRGQGVAARLVAFALDDVRAQGLRVDPQCWYVADYLDRHPEYADLTVG